MDLILIHNYPLLLISLFINCCDFTIDEWVELNRKEYRNIRIVAMVIAYQAMNSLYFFHKKTVDLQPVKCLGVLFVQLRRSGNIYFISESSMSND